MLTELLGAGDLAGLVEAQQAGHRWHGPAGSNADRFTALAPEPALRRLLTADRFVAGRVRAIRAARPMPFEMVMERGLAGWHLVPGALHELSQQGVSLVIDRMDREFAAIGALSAALERRFSVKSWTNAYWSHGRESAFKPHSDNHDVLILHVSGCKRWQFWGPIEPDPIVSRPYHRDALPAPAAELLLRPGDMLFVSRGDVHCAQLESGASFHLTLALERRRVEHLLDGLKPYLTDAPAARADLPADSDEADEAARAQIRDLLERLPAGALTRGFDRSLLPRTVINLGVEPSAETLLVATLRSAPAVEKRADGGVTISSGPFRAALTAPEWSVLEHAMAPRSPSFGDLPDTFRRAAGELIGRGLLYALAPSEWRADASG